MMCGAAATTHRYASALNRRQRIETSGCRSQGWRAVRGEMVKPGTAAVALSSLLVHRGRSTEIVQDAAELVWRRTGMLPEEAGEIALRAEAERIRNGADRVMLLMEPADRQFDAQRIEI
jgi:hypothetical protein